MTQNSTSKSDLQYATWVKECLEKEAFSKKLMSTCSWNISVPHSKFLAKALTSYHPNINKRTSSKGATHLCCTCFCLTVAHFQEFCQKSHVARRQDHWNCDISLLQTKLHLAPINCSGNKRPGKECHPNHGHKYCSRGCFLTLKQNKTKQLGLFRWSDFLEAGLIYPEAQRVNGTKNSPWREALHKRTLGHSRGSFRKRGPFQRCRPITGPPGWALLLYLDTLLRAPHSPIPSPLRPVHGLLKNMDRHWNFQSAATDSTLTFNPASTLYRKILKLHFLFFS